MFTGICGIHFIVIQINTLINLGHGCKAWFKHVHHISAVSNTIETIDNEMFCFIMFRLNCIRHSRIAKYEPGLHIRRQTL